MATVHEKKSLKILNYYNEMSSYTKEVQYPNIQFLGVKYSYNNPLLCFKLQNGKQFRRQLYDNGMYYEHVPTKHDNEITDEEKQNINFDDIDESGEKVKL